MERMAAFESLVEIYSYKFFHLFFNWKVLAGQYGMHTDYQ